MLYLKQVTADLTEGALKQLWVSSDNTAGNTEVGKAGAHLRPHSWLFIKVLVCFHSGLLVPSNYFVSLKPSKSRSCFLSPFNFDRFLRNLFAQEASHLGLRRDFSFSTSAFVFLKGFTSTSSSFFPLWFSYTKLPPRMFEFSPLPWKANASWTLHSVIVKKLLLISSLN